VESCFPALTLKKPFAIAGLVLLLSASAFAQASAKAPETQPAATPASATPSADQLVDRYVEAIGGRAAWKKLNSRISTGTIDVPKMSLSGTVEIREKAPNHLLATIIIAGASFRQGFDGKVAWIDDPQNGLHEESGAELEDTRRDADFYHPLDLHTLYSKFTVTGKDKIGDREVYTVEATRAGSDPDKLYFDTQTGLVLRLFTQHHTAEGVTAFQEDLQDYREVDGVKLPFTVHQTTSDSEFTIKFTEVRQNVDLDDAQFSKPAAQ
jgi:photosynthetic reaction center cytochrome c subunit